MWRELSKNSRSFLFPFFSPLVEWYPGTKALQASLSRRSARDHPCSEVFSAGRAPNFLRSPFPLLLSTLPPVSFPNAVCGQVWPQPVCLRSWTSPLSGQLQRKPSSSIKQTCASLNARWHQIISTSSQISVIKVKITAMGFVHFKYEELFSRWIHSYLVSA